MNESIHLYNNFLSYKDLKGQGASLSKSNDKKPVANDKVDWNLCLQSVAQNRDRASYLKFYYYFAPKIKSYFILHGASADQASDYAQETLLKVWRKASQYNASLGSAQTWLYRIARNVFYDELRKQQRSPKTESSDEDYKSVENNSDGKDNPGESYFNASQVRGKIEGLPQQQRDVLMLSYFEGKSHSEIAEELKIPLGTVKSSIRLAFSKLKKSYI